MPELIFKEQSLVLSPSSLHLLPLPTSSYLPLSPQDTDDRSMTVAINNFRSMFVTSFKNKRYDRWAHELSR